MRELLLVLAVAIGTYALRASMIVRVRSAPLPDVVRRSLRHLSPAILAALIASALLLGPHGGITLRPAPLLAGLTAALVASRTTSIPLVLLVGVTVHETVRWLL
jgi:branched-subunit amino acid transport protein